MNLREIRELVDLVVEKGFTEFELERSGTRLRLKRDMARSPDPSVLPPGPVISYAPIAAPVPVATLPSPPAPPALEAVSAPAAPETEEILHIVKSPIVGTFYEAASPGKPAFVKVGDTVAAGQALCIIEAMKLMNEIESDVAGEIVKRLVANGQPVEYGQPLFAIRPRK
jgi:acetyl-CoA carboxylase biotin carboxyl carrier protein